MPISWNEIKDRSLKFSKEWKGETREHAEAKTFWDDFFHVFGVTRRRLAAFEQPVKKLNDKYGFIDLFWKGHLLVEHKSKGKNLDKAYSQALDYFSGLKERDLPKYVLVSDFENFRLYDLDENKQHNFSINEFYKNIKLFGFIAGYQKVEVREEDPVNIKAAELMGKLHDQLEQTGYEGHPLEIFLVRILFCLFAEDTGIFEKDLFREYIEIKTNEDGTNLGALLSEFFQVLNTPWGKRLKSLDEALNQFPYINGKLFEEPLPIPAFNSQMREIMLECSALDWSRISPAIFGSMFQSVMKPEERRNLGAHYTSEKNIMKLIKPLFLDELKQEFEKAKSNKSRLKEFHKKLASLKFLDPACGCGNFLIITYRELRELELEVLKKLFDKKQKLLTIEAFVQVDVDQFYGIEYDEWPARISEVAMWLIDHQMNLKVSEEFGQYFVRLPLKKSAKIINGNALRIDWEEIVPKNELNYILGNPPFVGSKLLNKHQREEMADLFAKVPNGKILDYVAAWYLSASRYINHTNIKAAFVSTNSITQGEQVSVLWNELINKYSIKINFAHTTFKWSNEAKGKAAVYCVIVGFSNSEVKDKTLFVYSDIKGDPEQLKAKNISPYLVDADDVFITRKNKPICNVPGMSFGNMPLDGGNLIINDNELADFLKSEPGAEKYILPLISAREFLNQKNRWCLWLEDINPKELKSMPLVLDRVQKVKEFRLASKAPSTQKHAATPALFRDRNRPDTFIVIPRVSSENRKYIPMGFFDKNNIVSDTCMSIPDGKIYHFGVLMSQMHMTWVSYVCGRLKSDFRYSKDIVYNNFPWPKNPDTKNKAKVEKCAQKILDVRAEFPESSLADLYDPIAMPPKLVKAHQDLDKALDLCYRPQPFTTEMSRIEFLFDLYKEYIQQPLK
ncbi:SAM-dependent methyltransferase [Desulfonema limicola]|uniref:site-specific DNA-methyltransferase (adenine-specific) n=1 Tax=Desulfonema limicola TaxID=45656 RepID=A0A975BBY6_9BACT|nr:DNA methyltransferase [Desulfonema limicola]QTA82435.1 SAM-dependent methyltransferase [Desulfonema limicola]